MKFNKLKDPIDEKFKSTFNKNFLLELQTKYGDQAVKKTMNAYRVS